MVESGGWRSLVGRGAWLACGASLLGMVGCELIAGIESRTYQPAAQGGAGATSVGGTAAAGGQGASTSGGGQGGISCPPAQSASCGPSQVALEDQRWPDSTKTCINKPDECIPGEDGYHEGRRAFVSDTATATVVDQVTGLVWQNAGLLIDALHEQAEPHCQGAGGDSAQWRVPTYLEMLSLMDYGRNSRMPAEIQPAGGVPGHWVEEAADNGSPGWDYYFMFGPHVELTFTELGAGEATWGGGGIVRSVRCVGGPRLTDRGAPLKVDGCGESGLVRDPRTGLEWQHKPSDDPLGWEEALDHCRRLCDNGGGWRLPSVKELGTIFDPDADRGPIAPFDPSLTVSGKVFWTSTPDFEGTNVFIIDFVPVSAFCFPIRTPKALPSVPCIDESTHRAWCVRTYVPD